MRQTVNFAPLVIGPAPLVHRRQRSRHDSKIVTAGRVEGKQPISRLKAPQSIPKDAQIYRTSMLVHAAIYAALRCLSAENVAKESK